jgi:hypothetical protein
LLPLEMSDLNEKKVLLLSKRNKNNIVSTINYFLSPRNKTPFLKGAHEMKTSLPIYCYMILKCV